MKALALSISNLKKRYVESFILFILWLLIYFNIEQWAYYFADEILLLDPQSQLTEAIKFFVFEVPKVFLLLILIVFLIGIVRTYFSPERTRKALEKKSLFLGNFLASILGIVTPFCSCSAVPLFIGFVEAGIPLGVTFSFLIAAPMINEVAVILLFTFFGWQIALLYISTGLTIAITSGYIIGKLKLEKHVEEWVYQLKSAQGINEDEKISLSERIESGYKAVKEIVYKVWIYIVIGIGVGAWIHGYVPENFMAGIMGKSAWWSVPLSVILGVPLYSNAAGVIPIMHALLEKGASLGTALAFMMSVIGLSLPELIILRKVLKLKLIIAFLGIVAAGIIFTGYIFNLVY